MPDNSGARPGTPGLNLLSLDGGGITGLSSLLIVKEIMSRAQANNQQDNILKPCELFDMIAGTGTGAISAVMLGRLRMSIDDAIRSYTQLTRSVFSERKLTFTGETGAFKATVLERELKAMVCRAVGDEDAKMMENQQPDEGVRCKVVVYAMSSYNLTSALPVAFRSYPSTATSARCAIWQALRATTAHPHMFKGIEVDVEGTDLKSMFTHGGLGCANPTPRLLEEARQEYPGRSVASITSIGTGHPRTIQIVAGRTRSSWTTREAMAKVMRVAQEMAEGSERVAEEIARRFTDVGSGYYRLNVQQGIQGVEASEWERLDEVAAHTRAYLDQIEVKLKIDRLVGEISQKAAVWETSHIDGRVPIALKVMRDNIRSLPPSSSRFTGREEYIAKARAYFTSGSQGRRVFVLYGLGGAGKTQIALRCAEELREQLPHVMFVDASSEQSIQTSLTAIAMGNNVGESYLDTLKWIGQHGRTCLLVLDNADDPKVNLQTYFPQSPGYNVMITTRCPEFAALTGDINAVCNVSGLEAHEALDLLLKTAKLTLEQMSETDKVVMYELLKNFEYLALAVVQAGAYIWKMRLSISQYWDRFSMRQQKLPGGNVGLGLDGYTRTVYTTWEMSLNQLGPRARELLFLVSFLHRDGIVEEMFQRAARNIQDYQPEAPSSSEQLEIEQWMKNYLSYLDKGGQWNDEFMNYIGELMSFSLVTYDQTARSYSIHPLVQDWAQTVAYSYSISPQHTNLLIALSIDWGKSSADYAYKRLILPHVNLVVASRVDKINVFDRLADAYRAVGRYQDEATLWEGIISTRKQHLGENHPRTLAAMSRLAWAYQDQHKLAEARELQDATLNAQVHVLGEENPETLKTMHRLAWTLHLQDKYIEAESLLATVVAIRKQVLGEDDPDTLESMDDLASIYERQGQLTTSEELRTKVMAIRKKTLGEDHFDTLEGMSNLAGTYKSQSRLTEAVTLYTTVLAARKRVLGEDHPVTLFSMHELAHTYSNQGRPVEAEALYTTVVTARKRVLGEDHPATLLSMHNLAYTCQEQDRSAEAEALYTIVVATRKRVLGEDHPATLFSMHELAYIYNHQGRLAEAEALYTTVIAARKRVLGEDHPHTLTSVHNLAYTYQKQGRLAEAEALYTTVVVARKRVLGEDHPVTLFSMHELAYTYGDQGRLAEAEALYTTVVTARKRVLGEDHPHTLNGMHNIAHTYQKQGRLAEAEKLYATVITAQKRVLGEEHPKTLISLHNLACTYQKQGRLAEAEVLYTNVVNTRIRVLREDCPETLNTMSSLAATYYLQGHFAEAESLQKVVLAACRRVLGSAHPRTVQAVQDLEIISRQLEKHVEADTLRKECITISSDVPQ